MGEEGFGVGFEAFLHEFGDFGLGVEDGVVAADLTLFVDEDDAEVVLVGIEGVEAFFGGDGDGGGEEELFVHEVPDFLTVAGEEPPRVGGLEAESVGVGGEEGGGVVLGEDGDGDEMEIRPGAVTLEEFLHFADDGGATVGADGVDVGAEDDFAAELGEADDAAGALGGGEVAGEGAADGEVALEDGGFDGFVIKNGGGDGGDDDER